MKSKLETISPIDGSVYVVRDYASESAISSALALAGSAHVQWQKYSVAERQAFCHKMIDAFVDNSDVIAEQLTWQMGRPICHTPGEVKGVEERARYMIDIAPRALEPVAVTADSDIDTPSKCRRYIKREPLGTVFVIAPWNYPYLTAINAVIPAIMAGNSVILRHSLQTPLCAEQLAFAFQQADLPKGVFQYLHLTHQDTEKVIQSDNINHIAFTGSVAVGAKVEQSAAGTFKSIGLELGGKDPAYIRKDADIDRAVDSVIDGAFFNAGQSCCGIERIYVDKTIVDSVLEKSLAIVNKYQLGHPNDLATTLGPVVKTSAADFIRAQTNEAISQGAVALVEEAHFPMSREGTPYLAPQILTQVNHSMRIMTEETFGPVVGIQAVSDDKEAIQLMNDSEFGLTAAVFTQDTEVGVAIGEHINTGTFFVNRCDYLDPALAWTGVKKSGRGCTLSRLGYAHLTRPKSFNLNTF